MYPNNPRNHRKRLLSTHVSTRPTPSHQTTHPKKTFSNVWARISLTTPSRATMPAYSPTVKQVTFNIGIDQWPTTRLNGLLAST
ncbi:unnamed protein product [Nesidiocoris tenuis]|uniref:Uncharacterized protein n=1 Tax=Nesidiocoris tenuis TaxID=355587 RepID=A0A6H5HF14_9HEMI|nr:unnamed protein product [Nesidiocoris tenuis]